MFFVRPDEDCELRSAANPWRLDLVDSRGEVLNTEENGLGELRVRPGRKGSGAGGPRADQLRAGLRGI
jgi:hypothetical protein